MKTGDAHIKRQIFGREVVVAVTRTEQQRLFSLSLSFAFFPSTKETINQLIINICSLHSLFSILYSLFSVLSAEGKLDFGPWEQIFYGGTVCQMASVCVCYNRCMCVCVCVCVHSSE